MIDIIIPAYNAHQTIEKTLCSIAYQDIDVNINVYIVNDASTKSYQNSISFFSNFLNIKELILKENRGPGYARGYGINHSKNPYIIFIDSDDVLFDNFSLKNMYNLITKENSDLVISSFIEETPNGFLEHHKDAVWLHGKMYKRKFLTDHKINFNDTRANEDNGFNQLILLHEPNISITTKFTYIWRNNQNSLTRMNDYEYRLKGLNGYAYNIEWALNKAIKANCSEEKIAGVSFSALVAMYYYYLEFQEEQLIRISKKLKKISNQYSLDENKRLEILEQQRKFQMNTQNKESLSNPIISFSEFLKLIEKDRC